MIYSSYRNTVADPEVEARGQWSSAKGMRVEMTRVVGCEEGVSPSLLEERSGDGAQPPPQKTFWTFE